MDICRNVFSPNYDAEPISVEFLVLHHTAGNLQRTLDLFTDSSGEVSSHLIISKEGVLFEVVRCWDGVAHRAWHSGASKWFDGNKKWEEFNNFSIGIELVNLNGNLFPYSKQQYEALARVVTHFRSLYPALNSASRVVGHEHIAGWRGKTDPGCMFDWAHFFKLCYPEREAPSRECICPPELKAALEKFLTAIPEDVDVATQFWHALSHVTETVICLLQEAYNK